MNEGQPSGSDLKAQNKFFKSFRYAAQGIVSAADERNFRVDIAAAACALALCALLQVPLWGWAAVVICIGAVLLLLFL